ncbi:uncharacterized protein A4U43_C05F7870 [Asparagus officinalis]|uniref:Glycosyl transferase 64 domain-containing protein n=1 Tax=Asparagus officinalis TaxID=4686 RepID=A0A5P1EUF4_ASPOF|nr:uncharacterized protein A4U43_C05F7870 [Asparagus officinalis]
MDLHGSPVSVLHRPDQAHDPQHGVSLQIQLLREMEGCKGVCGEREELRGYSDEFCGAAVEGGEGPLVVEAKGGVRDWGDPRNDDGGGERGLSGRRDHWKKRGECIREFHKVFGEMPLRYSYGKLVEEIGEQGLCVRGGKMVYCDQQS